MDPQTVTALCDVLLVIVGIIGLLLMKGERRTVLEKEEAGSTAKKNPA